LPIGVQLGQPLAGPRPAGEKNPGAACNNQVMNPGAHLLAPGTGAVWLRVGTLLDGTSLVPVRDGHLVYSADTILHAGAEPPPATVLRPGQTAPDAVLPQYTVLPGLIEAHAHLFLEGGEENPVKRAV
jgi:hypothetical protein